MSDFREEEFSPSPLEAAGNQEVLDFTTSPFTIKGACILTQAREFFGARTYHFLHLQALPIKLLLLAPTICFLIIGLNCSEQYELRLSNISICFICEGLGGGKNNPPKPCCFTEINCLNESRQFFFLFKLWNGSPQTEKLGLSTIIYKAKF